MIQVRAGVLAADLGEEIVLLHPDDGAYFALNETGGQLWRLLCAGPVAEDTLTEAVAEQLAAGWMVDRRTAEDDVRALLAELAECGLVTGAQP
ncbi:hypothetical protein FDG2_2776 [Candidatus Protofrankia californiensis]|uniref:PqqD family protein n=1 Tax=Candidatus Protofrankia californiensis TaxID=1839754 RepID=A0A1C3NYC3_9ACTN|nr:hypothetical protein FDG2_2776 [Candidatus Protofrankia californiensis]